MLILKKKKRSYEYNMLSKTSTLNPRLRFLLHSEKAVVGEQFEKLKNVKKLR